VRDRVRPILVAGPRRVIKHLLFLGVLAIRETDAGRVDDNAPEPATARTALHATQQVSWKASRFGWS